MKLVKQPQRLFVQMKKAVLREDLMVVTKDLTQALVLGQMLYWTKTLDKVNDWLFEENKRLADADLPQHNYNYGWIYKSAREMKEDLMNAFSEDAIGRAFAALTSKGILMKRNNPIVRYDRKLHYRVDLVLLRRLLKESGYDMTDFKLETIPQDAECIPQGAEWIPRIAESIPQGAETITEIITENKIEIINKENNSSLISSKQPVSRTKDTRTTEEFVEYLKKTYDWVDIDIELKRIDAWLARPANRGRNKTRRFVENWISRQEKPMQKETYKPGNMLGIYEGPHRSCL
jgi:hypothetical protein